MVNNIGDDENKMVSYKVVLWLLAVLLMLGWGTKVYADAMQAQDTLGDDGTLFLYAGAAVRIPDRCFTEKTNTAGWNRPV